MVVTMAEENDKILSLNWKALKGKYKVVRKDLDAVNDIMDGVEHIISRTKTFLGIVGVKEKVKKVIPNQRIGSEESSE